MESTLCRPSGWGPCQAHVRPEESCVLVMGLADAQLSLGPPHFQAHLPSFQPPTPAFCLCSGRPGSSSPLQRAHLGCLLYQSPQGPSGLGLPQASGLLSARTLHPQPTPPPNILPALQSQQAPPLLQSSPLPPSCPLSLLVSSHPQHSMGSLGSPTISPVTPANKPGLLPPL